jgi:predicted ATPase
LALQLHLPLIGGFVTELAAGFQAARLLQPCMQLEWKRETKRGFFFRAEDFSDFINGVEKAQNSIEQSLSDLRGNVDDAIITTMGENMNRALQEMRRDYGENMQAFSHGEAYLKILQTRIADKGIYLLDEPEAALSPIRQLSLIAFILEVLKKKNSQFIIATHSPLLMGIPNAVIYEIQEDSIKAVAWEETDHYRITKTFLDNPAYYLRHLV